MSLLFNRPLSVNTSFALKKEGNKGGRDTALLGKKLWNILAPADDAGRVCLSIQPLHGKAFASTHTALDALTCWAVFDDMVRKLSPLWKKLTHSEPDR
jgi:hypothetical protein